MGSQRDWSLAQDGKIGDRKIGARSGGCDPASPITPAIFLSPIFLPELRKPDARPHVDRSQ